MHIYITIAEVKTGVTSVSLSLEKIILKENQNVLIYSVDLNLEMLNEAKKRFNDQQKKNIKFINANAENLPFENNFFDKYVISFCLRNFAIPSLTFNLFIDKIQILLMPFNCPLDTSINISVLSKSKIFFSL